jgi:hypothetical protein
MLDAKPLIREKGSVLSLLELLTRETAFVAEAMFSDEDSIREALSSVGLAIWTSGLTTICL